MSTSGYVESLPPDVKKREENIWKLCEHVRQTATHEDFCQSYAVFISNRRRTVPIWNQKLGSEERPVVWDYHVIFIYENAAASWVFDFDTTLPFACQFPVYMSSAIGSDESLRSQYHRYFRVVPAAVFLNQFASDRSHMKTDSGQYKATPPEYPCIATADCVNNLDDFINMDTSHGWGVVMGSIAFKARFTISSIT